ncbi:MAG: hypothetical protein WD845_10975 [Pirellulales bacterium]
MGAASSAGPAAGIPAPQPQAASQPAAAAQLLQVSQPLLQQLFLQQLLWQWKIPSSPPQQCLWQDFLQQLLQLLHGAAQPQAASAAQPQAGSTAAAQPQAGSAAAAQPQAGSAAQPQAEAQPLLQQLFLQQWPHPNR